MDVLPPTTPEQHWARLKYFLENICPVAEKYGMRLCAHPDDPTIEYLKGAFVAGGARRRRLSWSRPQTAMWQRAWRGQALADCPRILANLHEF